MGSGVLLSVVVNDTDARTTNLNPPAEVHFKLLHPGYLNGERLLGSNYTNASGVAEFYLNITSCDYQAGQQKWVAEILPSNPYYKENKSLNFTITLDMTGCQAAVDVYNILNPNETFQYTPFYINSTITAWIASAKNVTVTITTPSGWIVENETQTYFNSVSNGSYTPVTWKINATTFGEFNVTVFANSSLSLIHI